MLPTSIFKNGRILEDVGSLSEQTLDRACTLEVEDPVGTRPLGGDVLQDTRAGDEEVGADVAGRRGGGRCRRRRRRVTTRSSVRGTPAERVLSPDKLLSRCLGKVASTEMIWLRFGECLRYDVPGTC